jgi:hypothetical protein
MPTKRRNDDDDDKNNSKNKSNWSRLEIWAYLCGYNEDIFLGVTPYNLVHFQRHVCGLFEGIHTVTTQDTNVPGPHFFITPLTLPNWHIMLPASQGKPQPLITHAQEPPPPSEHNILTPRGSILRRNCKWTPRWGRTAELGGGGSDVTVPPRRLADSLHLLKLPLLFHPHVFYAPWDTFDTQ